MRVLIAEDDAVTARVLEGLIGSWNYEAVTVRDGSAALAVLQADNAPQLALLDWMMPGLQGVDVCRLVRERRAELPTYLILLTSRGDRSDVVAGLRAGADDYLVKPFDTEELHARLHVGARIVDLQRQLANHVSDLEHALASVRQLSGLLPICSYCKSIRNDSDYWQSVEQYVTEHSEAQFSHGICPKCFESVKNQMFSEV